MLPYVGEQLLVSHDVQLWSVLAPSLSEHSQDRFGVTGTSDATSVFWGISHKEMELVPLHNIKLTDDPITNVAMDHRAIRVVAVTTRGAFSVECIGSDSKSLRTCYASECSVCNRSTQWTPVVCRRCRRFTCGKCMGRTTISNVAQTKYCKTCHDQRKSLVSDS